MDILVRYAIYEDLDDAALIASNIEEFSRYGITQQYAKATFQNIIGNKQLSSVLVAVVKDEIVGVAWQLNYGAFATYPYLGVIGVKEKFRGKGVGSRLIFSIEDLSKGCLFILANTYNKGAIDFFKKLGYSELSLFKSGHKEQVILQKEIK